SSYLVVRVILMRRFFLNYRWFYFFLLFGSFLRSKKSIYFFPKYFARFFHRIMMRALNRPIKRRNFVKKKFKFKKIPFKYYIRFYYYFLSSYSFFFTFRRLLKLKVKAFHYKKKIYIKKLYIAKKFILLKKKISVVRIKIVKLLKFLKSNILNIFLILKKKIKRLSNNSTYINIFRKLISYYKFYIIFKKLKKYLKIYFQKKKKILRSMVLFYKKIQRHFFKTIINLRMNNLYSKKKKYLFHNLQWRRRIVNVYTLFKDIGYSKKINYSYFLNRVYALQFLFLRYSFILHYKKKLSLNVRKFLKTNFFCFNLSFLVFNHVDNRLFFKRLSVSSLFSGDCKNPTFLIKLLYYVKSGILVLTHSRLNFYKSLAFTKSLSSFSNFFKKFKVSKFLVAKKFKKFKIFFNYKLRNLYFLNLKKNAFFSKRLKTIDVSVIVFFYFSFYILNFYIWNRLFRYVFDFFLNFRQSRKDFIIDKLNSFSLKSFFLFRYKSSYLYTFLYFFRFRNLPYLLNKSKKISTYLFLNNFFFKLPFNLLFLKKINIIRLFLIKLLNRLYFFRLQLVKTVQRLFYNNLSQFFSVYFLKLKDNLLFKLEKQLKLPVNLIFYNLFDFFSTKQQLPFFYKFTRLLQNKTIRTFYQWRSYLFYYQVISFFNFYLLNFLLRLLLIYMEHFLKYFFFSLSFFYYFYLLLYTFPLNAGVFQILTILNNYFLFFFKIKRYILIFLSSLIYLRLFLNSKFIFFYRYLLTIQKSLTITNHYLNIIPFKNLRLRLKRFFLHKLKGQRLKMKKRIYFLLVLRYLLLAILFRSVKLMARVISYFFRYAKKKAQRPLFYMLCSFFSLFIDNKRFHFFSGVRFVVRGKLRNFRKTRELIYEKAFPGLYKGTFKYPVVYSHSFSLNRTGVFGIHLWIRF
ncbi:MAG: hypothetical protein KIT69_14280, partial [Propionibacteriaceae bacterium]|nr:hypothetical protein [Propionibacteriaceae bacterium]